MANMEVDGLDRLLEDFSAIADLPDEVAEAMLDAEAKIVEDAQVYTGMKKGVYRTGETLMAVARGKMKRAKDGSRAKHVYPRGKNSRGIRNAEVAFINEYGAPNRDIPARQFIREANESAADPAVEAAAKVMDEFLEKNNL